MPRKSYSSKQKVAMVRTMEERMANDRSLSRLAVARDLGVDASQIRKWQQQIALHQNKLTRTPGTHHNPHARSLHSGRKSCLHDIEELLLRFIFEKREQGIAVDISMVVNTAKILDVAFRGKSDSAQYQVVRRFVVAHGLVYRVCTHVSQRNATMMKMEAIEWMRMVRPLLLGNNRDPRFILNMDQTPIFFLMTSKTTLDPVGSKTVHVRSSKNASMRVTVAVTVTSSGDMLPPMFVFKGAPGGRIQRESATYGDGAIYSVQQKAWMDEVIMTQWIEKVLSPFCETKPVGIEPILFLDSYRCHMMGTIVKKIQDLGIQVEHIPAGCTSICQP
jgi:transposase-like protein